MLCPNGFMYKVLIGFNSNQAQSIQLRTRKLVDNFLGSASSLQLFISFFCLYVFANCASLFVYNFNNLNNFLQISDFQFVVMFLEFIQFKQVVWS